MVKGMKGGLFGLSGLGMVIRGFLILNAGFLAHKFAQEGALWKASLLFLFICVYLVVIVRVSRKGMR